MLPRSLVLPLVSLMMCCTPRAGDGAAPPSPLVLRSYEVPNNGAQRLRAVLRELFTVGAASKDGTSSVIGRADVGPDGRLLVLAPDDVQEGVKALVSSASAKQAKAPSTLRLVYWAVLGSAGTGDAGARPPLDEALKDLAPGLAELEKSDGPQTFTLLEKLTVSSLSGERAWLNGREVSVSHLASSEGGQVLADVKIERHSFGQRYEARVQLKPGQLVVLASAGLVSRDANDAGRTVYFFVRAFSNDGE